jgi:hypothetical protein
MFSREVSIMLKQLFGFSLSRHVRSWQAASALLVIVAACNPTETRSSGYLEVFPRRSEDAACDVVVPGHLQLDGVVASNVASITGEELCKSQIVRRELPAGLYSVSWQPNADAETDDDAEHWALGGASVVSIFADQVTRLRVRQLSPDRAVASRLE